MLRRLLPISVIVLTAFAILAISAGSAIAALDCPSPETKGQTPGGYTICKPAAGAKCGPGRKYARHAKELVPMCEDAGPAAKPAAKPAATVQGKCAVGEEASKYSGYSICKPIGGKCGKGRKHVPHHRNPSVVVCEDDPRGTSAAHTEITCPEYERPYFPKNKSFKPFCEPVGRCGYGRVAVSADVPGKKMCIKR